jgi:hypothetical protein
MPKPEDVVRALLEAYRSEEWDRVEELVHPAAEFRTFFAPDAILRGREEVPHALKDASARFYSINVHRFEQINERTVLGTGTVRYTRPGGRGYNDHGGAWVWTVEAGMVKTWTAFASIDEARDTSQRRREGEP